MKFYFFILLFCVSLVALVSCASKKPTAPVILTKTKVIKETIKDTVWEIKADSSFYKAYIDCRDGKPILIDKPFISGSKEMTVQKTKGNYLKTPKVILTDGILNVNCEAEAQKLFKQWRESYIYEKEPVPIEIPKIEYRDKPYSWFVKIQLWAGRLFIIGSLAILFYLLIKTKWKIF